MLLFKAPDLNPDVGTLLGIPFSGATNQQLPHTQPPIKITYLCLSFFAACLSTAPESQEPTIF